MGDAVLDGLETAVDDLATAYPGTAPGDLLVRVRVHLGYVGQLMDTRATLTQRRRLMVTGGWLSLLAATCLIDLHKDGAATAHRVPEASDLNEAYLELSAGRGSQR